MSAPTMPNPIRVPFRDRTNRLTPEWVRFLSSLQAHLGQMQARIDSIVASPPPPVVPPVDPTPPTSGLDVFAPYVLFGVGAVVLARDARGLVFKSEDGGQSFASLGAGFVSYTGSGFLGRDAALSSGNFLSLGLNSAANVAGQIVGLLSAPLDAVDSRNNPALESWTAFGYPRTTLGRVIQVFALFSGGETFYVVGTYADAPASEFRLFSAGSSAVFIELGLMQTDPADPNAVSATNSAAWANWIAGAGGFGKIGSRWWLATSRALYYSDSVVPISGWRRAPLGFGEETRTTPVCVIDRIPVVMPDGTLLCVDRGADHRIGKSSNGGDSWAVVLSGIGIRLSQMARVGDIAFSRSFTSSPAKMLVATPPYSEFSETVAVGIEAGANLLLDSVYEYGGRVLAATRSQGVPDVRGRLVTTEDGVTWVEVGAA